MLTRSKRRRVESKVALVQRRWRKLRGLTDPITMDRIQRPFVYIDENGSETWFDSHVLASYILSSGDYRNPLTRKPFNMCEVRRLAKISGVHDILNTEKRKEERALTQERNSLRDFFLSELEHDLEVIREHSTVPFVSFQVRHMVTAAFPNLVINSVRIMRTDSEFLPDYFHSMLQILSNYQQEASANLHLQFVTATQIFEQFCRDLQSKCMDGSIMDGDRAQVSVGGMLISVDMSTIV
jgi:hypothetical protein